MSGNTTISTSESRIEALALQSSAYGVTIPVLYGVNRISGNLIWYGDFKAIPHTTSQSSGGKGGGGVNQVSTTYTYSASVMMGLCEGEVIGVSQIWKAKKLYSGGVTPVQILTATESYVIPVGGGTFTVAHVGAFAAKGTVAVHHATGGGKSGFAPFDEYLVEDVDYTVTRGVYVFKSDTWAIGQTVSIAYQYTSGGASQTSLQQLSLSLATGAVGQATWPYLYTFTPTGGSAGAQAVGYSGTAYVYAQDYNLGSNGTVDNHSFEVQGTQAYSIASTIPDANPALIAFDLLTSTRYGAGYSKGGIYDLADWSSYCLASGIVLSPALEQQIQASAFVTQICAVTNTAPVWTGGKLKFIPYGDTALTANGATFAPNVTPVYDLTDNDFIADAGSDPIRVTRKPQSDAFNHIRVEFLNRGNYYNVDIAEAKDSAAIDAFGLRSADVLQCHWICTAPIAQAVAQLLLQRSVYIRNTYAFNLPWTRAMLEPMDLVTLTDSGLGYNKLTVRVTEVSESESGDLALTAEDFPVGVAHAAIYPAQVSAGFQHNYNAAPSSVSAPTIFEAPIQLTTTGLEVYAAVWGAGALWGGCRVWVSLDGTTYKESSILYGPSRYGTITGPISAGTLPVQISAGQLISGSAADAANLATLCYVGGASPEYFAYTTATLTGTGAYTLGGLNRNAYLTNQANGNHVAANSFVRVDKAIAKSGPLDPALIGKTIYLKFTSFNIYNASEESLANVTAYPYAITGAMLLLPPSNVIGFTSAIGPSGISLSWTDIADVDRMDYEIRQGASWALGMQVTRTATLDYQIAPKTAGSYTYWIAARDNYLNYSPTPVSTTVTVVASSAPAITYAISGPDEYLTWTIPASGFAVDRYEIRAGASWAAGVFVDTTKATGFKRKVDYAGAKTYWVAAIDAAGNVGTAGSVSANISVPGAATGLLTSVVDNNALIYWGAPVSGTLPVDRYEVRRGASWASGTVIGSNGNSTFTTFFEQQSGTYTYWVSAIDSAGNYGPAVSTVAYINQPPDYILRANINSTFGGTKVNAVANSGGLLLPVNATETWQQHYVNNAWASPQAQIAAGYPLYMEPGLTTASYSEVIDYGSTLPATNIIVTLNSTPVVGSVSASCQIQYSNTSATGPWTNGPVGATAVLASNFRWVQVTYTFASAGGANLLQINGLNILLSVKQRNDSGAGTVSVAATGAVVTFGYPFISADTPLVQPQGATPLIPVVVYAGGANPTGFTVYLYTLAGALTTGSFSWTVRGF
jgi:hypothetical protein